MCQMCGQCCRYYCGLITLSLDEIKNYEKIKPELLKFLKKDGKRYIAWYKDGAKLEVCPYQKDNKCAIHDIKPIMCRVFNCNDHPEFLRVLDYSSAPISLKP